MRQAERDRGTPGAEAVVRPLKAIEHDLSPFFHPPMSRVPG
jgi:hypothetical protein